MFVKYVVNECASCVIVCFRIRSILFCVTSVVPSQALSMVQVTQSYKKYRPYRRHSSYPRVQAGDVCLVYASECNGHKCQQNVSEPFNVFRTSDKSNLYTPVREQYKDDVQHIPKSSKTTCDRHQGPVRHSRSGTRKVKASSRSYKCKYHKDEYRSSQCCSRRFQQKPGSNYSRRNSTVELPGVPKKSDRGEERTIIRESSLEMDRTRQYNYNTNVRPAELVSPREVLVDEEDLLIQAMNELVAIVDGVDDDKRMCYIELGDCLPESHQACVSTDDGVLMEGNVGNPNDFGIYAQQSIQYCIDNCIGSHS